MFFKTFSIYLLSFFSIFLGSIIILSEICIENSIEYFFFLFEKQNGTFWDFWKTEGMLLSFMKIND